MPGPLTGVRAIELANYLSGPYCGQMLADLGSEVIKVEAPAGDPFRHFGRPGTYVSSLFANCNRGKRSIVLDLERPQQRQALFGLIDAADILLCNWRPGVAVRLGLRDEELARRNPRLVRVYITGYGSSGPLALEPAYDSVVQARSGATRGLWSAELPVLLPGFPIDKLSAVMAAQAALAALYARERTGRGEKIELAMLDAASYLNFVDLFAARAFLPGQTPDPRNLHASAMRALRASDGFFVVSAVSGTDIRRTCEVAGHPEWSAEILATRDPAAMVHVLLERLESVTPSAPVEEWLRRLRERDVPAARCASIDEHLADDQVAHNGIYRLEDWPGIGPVRSARYPARFASCPPLHAPGPAPVLGADTDAVLAAVPGTDALSEEPVS
jgi:crotonobetainyl-CoA:carnitine CoA-transferase CaiB-like acyl-CoA transferase